MRTSTVGKALFHHSTRWRFNDEARNNINKTEEEEEEEEEEGIDRERKRRGVMRRGQGEKDEDVKN